jgi:predicted RNA-binding protein YlqC (UPF0109 family)
LSINLSSWYNVLQNDGRSHQQGNYGAHNLSYFDQGTTEAGSPPPNSATASGSTSTSTSLGVSADQAQGSTSSSSQYSQQPSTTMSQTPHATETVDVPTTSTHAAKDGKQNPTSFQSAIKLLVSNNVAGSIIGRLGQTISELQTQSSARIKLSQTGDYYPGTQDRVCLVQGQLSTVKLAVKLLLERFYMLQEQQHTQHLAWQPKKGENAPTPTGFDFVVRLLVPSSSCGMIIGKAGANIKHMEESSGVSSVRLSPKDGLDQPQAQQHQTGTAGPGTQERAVTLTGPSKESCTKCLFIVIDGMFANHEISRYTNMTTSYLRHLVPGTYTPAPQQQPGRPPHMGPSPTGEWDNQDPYGGTFMIKKSTSQPDLSHMSMEQQRRLQSRIHSGSFVGGGGGVTQIDQREPSLQQFNQTFMDSSQQPYSSEMPPPPPQMMPNQDRGQRSNAPVVPMYLLGGSNPSLLDHHPPILSSTSAPDLLALQFQDSLRLSNTLGPPSVDYNHFAPQMPQPTRPGFTAQILVPDTLIGSILGRGGRTLNELQLHSNTRIRISQRGEYVPGTRNRIVTIRGQTAHSVSLAQYMMSQRMVLPPTATFSAGPPVSPSYLHTPPQHQQQQQHPPSPQRFSPHQQSSHYNAPLDLQAQQPQSAQQQYQQQNQVLHETSFLPTDTHPYNPDNER